MLVLIPCTSGTAAETLTGFSTEAWRNAADPRSDNWSRAPLLRQFAGSTDIRALSRGEIIRWLGAPGVAHKIFSPGEGLTSRIDLYRLSAKNDDSFRIDYDGNDKVTANFIEASSCACELCELTRADAASVSMDALEGSVLKRHPDGQRKSVTLSEVESRLGHPGQHHTEDARIGGQMWVISSALWHVAGNPHGLFIATGTRPRTENKDFDQVPVESFAIVEAWPGCLPQ